MAVTSTPVFEQAINVLPVQILAADNQTYKTAFTAGANGSKIESMIVTSNDTSARDITINITRSATNYQLAQISIPITAGYLNTAPCVNILQHAQFPGLAYDANGNKYLLLKSGDTLTVNAPVSLTAAKAFTIFTSGGDL